MSSPSRRESATGIAPSTGQPVDTRDGHTLGTVKEVSGTCFLLDIPHARDRWLDASFVLESKADRLVMDFDYEVRDDYLMDDPEAAAPSPVLDAESDSFSSAGELAE